MYVQVHTHTRGVVFNCMLNTRLSPFLQNHLGLVGAAPTGKTDSAAHPAPEGRTGPEDKRAVPAPSPGPTAQGQGQSAPPCRPQRRASPTVRQRVGGGGSWAPRITVAPCSVAESPRPHGPLTPIPPRAKTQAHLLVRPAAPLPSRTARSKGSPSTGSPQGAQLSHTRRSRDTCLFSTVQTTNS